MSATEADPLGLRRMDVALVRASLAHPDVLDPADVRALRYALGLARIGTFRPGAAARGGWIAGTDVDLSAEVDAYAAEVSQRLGGALRGVRDAADRLRGAGAALGELRPVVAGARNQLLGRDVVSAADLDAEAGTRTLVSVPGGGGGAGYVYIGAYQRLEEAGIVPGYVVGSSIGALMGLFRARARSADWEGYVALARGLDRTTLFAGSRQRRRFGLPGLLPLHLDAALSAHFRAPGGRQLTVGELEIPYDAVVAGVRRDMFERLPVRFRRAPGAPARSLLSGVPGVPKAAVLARVWQVAAFFDPRLVKPVMLGGDDLTSMCEAVDAAGFSASIPGILHYDIPHGDARGDVFKRLADREDVAAFVDGGVANNVPAELAHRRVRAGRIGTRNTVSLAFDCFHPQWDPVHLPLQPITQAIQLQMLRNAPFADWVLRFDPTLSPLNLLPDPAAIDQAVQWGRDAVEPVVPMIQRLLEPVRWEE